jgi:hypothetical protein
MYLMGGLVDLLVPPSMYRWTFTNSLELKRQIEFPGGHLEPALEGGVYVTPTTDFMYAALLGDIPRWSRFFPR